MDDKKILGLKKHAKEKTEIALKKVEEAIRSLSIRGLKINFNSVVKESGVSKSFIYNQSEIRERIETIRKKQIDIEVNRKSKTEKTSKTKDILIAAKDKKIKELNEEITRLKTENKVLKGKLYYEK